MAEFVILKWDSRVALFITAKLPKSKKQEKAAVVWPAKNLSDYRIKSSVNRLKSEILRRRQNR
jgi:hypothetical protein